MALQFSIIPHQLKFKFKAGTSRGVYTTHDVYYIFLKDGGIIGIGEVAPLKGLSIDAIPSIKEVLKEKLNVLSKISLLPKSFTEVATLLDSLDLDRYPAIRFGIETALLDLKNGGRRLIFENKFSVEGKNTPINGLIWMGEKEFMFQQVKDKIEQGFSCIKMKIGAIDFKEECEILKYIRTHFSEDEIELRVDANGAFDTANALEKLNVLSDFYIHSIEQPIGVGQYEEMMNLCQKSPISIALDEELIGISNISKKKELLTDITPQYIILKPTLVGGLYKSKEWIDEAEKQEIDWWFTSALESNIGLNAISQYTSEFDNQLPQGLGTGGLYHNNIGSPLVVDNGEIRYDKNTKWELSLFSDNQLMY